MGEGGGRGTGEEEVTVGLRLGYPAQRQHHVAYVQVQPFMKSQKKLAALQAVFLISFEGQLGSVLNFKPSDAERQLLHNNKHRLSH